MSSDAKAKQKAPQELVDFSAILCSRLCHDLVSPVGALANGIEILVDEEDPEMRKQVISLLEDSARQTSNRLQFFRLAFGAAGGFGELVDLREARKAIESLLSNGKIALEWEPTIDPVRKDVVKLLLNIVLLMSESLIKGGTLKINLKREGGSLKSDLHAVGPRILFSEKARQALAGDEPEAINDPRCAPAYLAHLLGLQLAAELRFVGQDAGQIRVALEVQDAF